MQDDFMHPTEMVHACIRDNNIFKLRVLLQSHPLPDFNRLSNWGTPLHVAVYCNSLVAVEMLLQVGADPIIDSDMEQTEWGDFLTPLSLAAREGHREIVLMLWHSNLPEIHIKNHQPFETCLAQAAYQGHVTIVTDLLAWWDGWPQAILNQVLYYAASRWEYYVVEELLASSSFDQKELDSALSAATRHKKMSRTGETVAYEGMDYFHQEQLVALLIHAGSNPNAHCETECPLIVSAVGFHDLVGGVKALLENGADPNAVDEKGTSALHILASPVLTKNERAATRRFCETGIRLLLKHGGSVCLQNNSGDAPIHLAAYNAPIRIFRLYLSTYPGGETAGALGSVNCHGETLLHFACAGGQLETVKYLLAHESINVNAKNLNGWSPLICALAPAPRDPNSPSPCKGVFEAVRIAQLLLSHGADPLVTTAEGWNPLHCLAFYPDSGRNTEVQDMVEHLIRKGVNMEARATLLIYHGAGHYLGASWGFRVFQKLKSLPKYPRTSKPGFPLLHWAAYHGAVGVLKVILENGVTLSMLNSTARTTAKETAQASPRLRYHGGIRKMILNLLETAEDQDWDSEGTMTA